MKNLIYLILIISIFIISCEKDIITNELSYEINVDSIAKAQQTRDSTIIAQINQHTDSALAKIKITVINKDTVIINNYFSSHDTTINNIITNNYDTTYINNINHGIDTIIYIPVKQDPIYYSPIAYSIVQPTCLNSTGSFTLTGLPDGVWYIKPFNIYCADNKMTFTGITAGTYEIEITNVNGYKSPKFTILINNVPSAPTAPIIGNVKQPTKDINTGSVELKGLPETGIWIITKFPDKTTIYGTGTTYTLSGLKSVPTGAKCTEATYTFTVTNSNGCTSAMSDKIIIKSYY